MIASYEMKNGELLNACIEHIANEIERVMGNLSQDDYSSPIYNNGGLFEIPEFKIRAYDWDWDMESTSGRPLPNFEWRDFKLWWYKYLGRGNYANREISNDELALMCNECLKAVCELEDELEVHKSFFRSDEWKSKPFIDQGLGIRIS